MAIGPVIDDGFYYDISSEYRFTPDDLNKILNEGKDKAEDLANQTLKRVKSKLGFFEMEK